MTVVVTEHLLTAGPGVQGCSFRPGLGSVEGYLRDMVDRPDPRCVPLETEMLPLYRDPPGSARLRREHKREQRRRKREERESPTRTQRVFARLAAAAGAVGRR